MILQQIFPSSSDGKKEYITTNFNTCLYWFI